MLMDAETVLDAPAASAPLVDDRSNHAAVLPAVQVIVPVPLFVSV